MVLGWPSPKADRVRRGTAAVWKIPVSRRAHARFHKGYVFVGCLRRFGGLHSRRVGSRVELLFNDAPIDGFALRIRPDDHSD